MKVLKKWTSMLIMISLLFTLSACSDLSWSVKNENTTLSIGTYIYYMSAAYSEAYYRAEDMTKDILDQTIEDKSASDWIKDKALEACKKLMYAEQKFDEMGLSFTDEELEQWNSTTNSRWDQYGKTYEGFGVDRDSFERAGIMYYAKLRKIFDATYKAGGTKEVSDEELRNYFLENYTNYSYFKKSLTKKNDEGKSEDMSEEEIAAVKSQFEAYQDAINNGTSFDEIAEKFKEDESLESNPVISSTENLGQYSSLTEELVDTLKEMSNNTAMAKEINNDLYTYSNAYYLLYKGDINEKVNLLEEESQRYEILLDLKYDEFFNEIDEGASQLNVEVNDRAVKKYKPTIFAKNS